METQKLSWEDFKKGIARLNSTDSSYEKTDAVCPKCGEPIYKRTDMILTCYPPKHRYECLECGWSDLA